MSANAAKASVIAPARNPATTLTGVGKADSPSTEMLTGPGMMLRNQGVTNEHMMRKNEIAQTKLTASRTRPIAHHKEKKRARPFAVG